MDKIMPTLTSFKYFIQQKQENNAIILDSDRLTRHKFLNYNYEYLTPNPAISEYLTPNPAIS